MKVSMNTSGSILHTPMQSGNTGIASVATSSVQPAAQKSEVHSLNNNAGLPQNKAMSDALAIAQMSRDIMQRAMEAVSRLKSIAGQTMMTGSVNMAELEVAAGLIPDGLDANSRFTPMSKAELPIQVEVLNTNTDVEQVKILAQDTSSGVKPERFDAMQGRLNERASEIDKIIEVLSHEMSETGKSFISENVQSASVLKDKIANNSQQAIAAQGNINSSAIMHHLS